MRCRRWVGDAVCPHLTVSAKSSSLRITTRPTWARRAELLADLPLPAASRSSSLARRISTPVSLFLKLERSGCRNTRMPVGYVQGRYQNRPFQPC